MFKEKKAVTLLEVILSCLILSLITGLLCVVFKTGASAWIKARNSTEIDESVQTAIMRMENDIRQSSSASMTVDTNLRTGDTISFLSPYDNLGRTDFDIYNVTPGWAKYVIYYLARDGDNDWESFTAYKILRKELDIAGENYGNIPVTEVFYKVKPSFYINNSHPELTPAYPQEGRCVARNITELEFYLTGDLLNIRVKGQKARDENTINLETSIYMRN